MRHPSHILSRRLPIPQCSAIQVHQIITTTLPSRDHSSRLPCQSMEICILDSPHRHRRRRQISSLPDLRLNPIRSTPRRPQPWTLIRNLLTPLPMANFAPPLQSLLNKPLASSLPELALRHLQPILPNLLVPKTKIHLSLHFPLAMASSVVPCSAAPPTPQSRKSFRRLLSFSMSPSMAKATSMSTLLKWPRSAMASTLYIHDSPLSENALLALRPLELY